MKIHNDNTIKEHLRILILEDLPTDAELAQRELKTVIKDPTIEVVDTEEGFVNSLKVFKPDLIISDYMLPTFDGLSALKIRQDKCPFIPFVILTGSMNEDTAVECMQAGADDYVIKEHIKRLGPAAINALEKKKIELKRKQGEEALQESEDKFRNFVETSNDLVFRLSKTGYIDYISPRVEDLYGYKPDELIGKHLKTTTPVREIPRAIEILKMLLAGETFDDYIEINQKAKDGRIIPMEMSSVPVYQNGKIVGLQGTMRDITERKQSEEKIRKLSTAIEQSPVSIVITDTDGVIEYVNPIFEKLTGYSINEAIGLKPSVLKTGTTSDSEYRELWETITKGKVWTGEFLNKKKNGDLYWESATISPIIDDNNNITHFLAIKEDITKKKQMINDLMEREEKYRTLTQNLNVGVYRSTPGKNGMFIEANPAFLEIFEFRSKKELENWKVVNFYPESTEYKNLEEKLASKGFLVNEEVKLRKKDGTIFNASISATLAKDESGKIIHYDGIIEDVTMEKKAREEILAYQLNLKSLTNELLVTEEDAKRRLAITLHDKLLQSLVLANFKSIELNKKIEKSAHKKLISEISGFIEDAIKESRNITYELSPPVLYEMGLIPAISWKLEEIEKNNKIKTSLTDQSKSYKFDEKEKIILYRTISELLQNALKHSKAKEVKVSFKLLTNNYKITVSDIGIGFDIETIREKAVSQKKFGLFSIMERIRFIGGEVLINAVPNKGTEVVINLPIKNK